MDATIAQLENIRAVVPDSEITTHADAIANDLYLVSHPLTQNSSDYTTYSITLSQLFDQLSTLTYPAIFTKIKDDLSLGELAFVDRITKTTEVTDHALYLDHIVNYGDLARIWTEWPTLSIDKDTDEGSELYQKTRKLGLGYLAHKDCIASADLSSNLLDPSQISGSKGYDGLIVSALSDLDLHDLAHTDLVQLYLSSFAHDGVVSANELRLSAHQMLTPVNFDSQVSGWQNTLNNHYLSAPKPDGSTFGSIKLGYNEVDPSAPNGNRQYALTTNTNGNAYVNVPWTYRSENLSISLEPGPNANTLVFTQTRETDVAGAKTLSSSSQTISLSPFIADNITRVGGTDVSGKVAVFANSGQISASGKLNGDLCAFYRANGTFSQLPRATRTLSGLMAPADVSYLYDLTSNLPVATSTLLGAVKIGYSETSGNRAVKLDNSNKMYVTMPENVAATGSTFGHVKIGFSKSGSNIPVQLNSSGQMFVDVPQLETCTAAKLGGIKVGYSRSGNNIPIKVDGSGNAYAEQGYATASQLGSIKTGFTATGKRYPVQLDSSGNAFVEVNWSSTGARDIVGDMIDSLYPVGAIYITAAEVATCPLAAFRGTWQKVTGKYLLGSGYFASTGSGRNVKTESHAAGEEVGAALPAIPSHTHSFSFGFSSGNSKDGYPQHGGGSQCNHSSYGFNTGGPSTTTSTIYGQSGSVRPQALVVSIFRRTA